MYFIEVSYKVYSTAWHIQKQLKLLEDCLMLSFDTETRSVYPKAEREEAKLLLKGNNLNRKTKKFLLQVENSSGLSYPSLVNVTHWILGLSESEVVILISDNVTTETLIANWVVNFKGKLLIHNALFDLKLLYHRTGKFPVDYVDTQLLAKTFINHVNVWQAKTSLKELMGEYYPPSWALYNNYEVENLKDPKFLTYCSYDGSGTFKLYEMLEQHIEDNKQ